MMSRSLEPGVVGDINHLLKNRVLQLCDEQICGWDLLVLVHVPDGLTESPASFFF